MNPRELPSQRATEPPATLGLARHDDRDHDGTWNLGHVHGVLAVPAGDVEIGADGAPYVCVPMNTEQMAVWASAFLESLHEAGVSPELDRRLRRSA